MDSQTTFADLDSKTPTELMLRREAILDTCSRDGVRDYASLSDEALSEMFEINRLLRKKNSGPPKARAPKASEASIDELE